MAQRKQRDNSGCPPAVLQLVERFDEHRETYKGQAYNETQVRREFIDPFFAALGWDVDNKAGHAEAYKDVIHEDAIKIGGSTSLPAPSTDWPMAKSSSLRKAKKQCTQSKKQ